MAALHQQHYKNQLERAYTGKYKAHGDPADADCLFGAGFGYRQHGSVISPSLSTRQIAEHITRFEHLPKILSHDLAAAYRKLQPLADELEEIIHPDHLSTIRLVNRFRDEFYTARRKAALLIAHPYQIPWLDFLCSQLAIKTVVPAGLQVAFDPVSVQPWTRDVESWQAEIRNRLQQGAHDDFYAETTRLHHE